MSEASQDASLIFYAYKTDTNSCKIRLSEKNGVLYNMDEDREERTLLPDSAMKNLFPVMITD